MKITITLIPGLPKKELVERIHFHQRQGDIAERALGFYLLDLEKRKMCRPFEDGSTWARKHLPDLRRPDKLILLARRLERSSPDRSHLPQRGGFLDQNQGDRPHRQAGHRKAVAGRGPAADLPGARGGGHGEEAR